MTTPDEWNDPAQTDMVWTGYHPRAAVPTLGATAAASLLVWTGRWYLEDLSALADRTSALVVFALAWSVWPVLALVFAYRAVTYTYRLTNRAVLIDFGFRHIPVPPVWLIEVAAIRARREWLSGWLGVGWVEVRTADRVIRMVGVRHPEEFAAAIRAAAANASNTAQGTDSSPG